MTSLKESRRKRKLTQAQAASLAQTCVRNYQNWESGKTKPNPFNIQLLNLEYAALDLGFASLKELLIKNGNIQPDPEEVQLDEWYSK
ncbi:TPA: helix-turn-helix domain-containing protein [Acinetobacter baumannii]|uniref:helix-turn-helix domain-containing protein n=1 Tax=Acinetobacter baumannii TaxID=470 RepID=UPI00225702B9|nr:helix-turn-helix domain-containing protein [Acinetobacter baumannii]MCX3034163.1 helix-turn-helix domain-containing protein [Acinetobacter baumannii]